MAWCSSSVSPQNPVMMSVLIAQSGMMRRMAAMRSRYHSRVYPRFMRLSMSLCPLCTGRWMYLQMFSWRDMACNTSSVMSLGWDVLNRTRRSGLTAATSSSNSAKRTTG